MTTQNVDMMYYIKETPAQVQYCLDNRKQLTKPLVDRFVGNPRNITVVACGSSSNGTHLARRFMMETLGVNVKVVTPYTFTHYEAKYSVNDLVVCVSQSGCSTNTIDALRKCKELGIETIGITGNTETSDFVTEADVLVDWGVQEETVGYVTKGVVTLGVFFDLFAAEAALATNRISEDRYQCILAQIKRTTELHPIMVSEFDRIYKANAKTFLSMQNMFAVGCGANMGTIMEAALKISETVTIPAVCYEVDEYIHGPNLQLTPNYTVIFVDGTDEPSKRVVQAYHATHDVTDHTFIITNDPSIDDSHALRIPFDIEESLTPLVNVVFFQLLAHTVSLALGSMESHPLMKTFNDKIKSKTEKWINHDDEMIRRQKMER